MVIVYTSPGCASCRKVKQFLKDRDIKFIERNIFQTLLDKDEIKLLLQRTDNGTDDIISKRSKIIQNNEIDLDSMTLNELVDFVIKNPSILRRPIIINERTLQVGYDKEEIDAFVPDYMRKLKSIAVCDLNCSNYEYCGKCREE